MSSLNTLADADLVAALQECGMSSAWAAGVAQQRPFGSLDDLLNAADAVLATLPDDDVRAALQAMPAPNPPGGDADTREAAAVACRLYQDRFGYPFVSGIDTPSAEALLMRVRIRLGNEIAPEWRAARDHLRRRVRTRLQQFAATGGG